MSRRFKLFLPLLALFTISATAQPLVWEAESETLLHFDPTCSTDTPLEAVPLKVVQSNAASASYTPFRDALINMIRSGKWPAFANDGELAVPHTTALERLIQVDTIITFDPETYEETLNVVKTDLLENCQRFWLRQEWKYYAGGKIECKAKAISPYLLNRNGEPLQPTIWFALPEAKERFNDPTHRRVQDAALLHYDCTEQQMEHTTGNWATLQQQFIEDFKNGQFKGYTENRMPIDKAQAAEIFTAVDTIYTIDPETYTESFEIVEREYRPEDMRALHLEQAWYLEPRSGRLQSELLRVAPAIAIVDEYGTLRFYKPMFFWKQ
jgi:hypothetical protein